MSAHTVTVTAVPNTDVEGIPEEDYIDSVQFTVECPDDGSCRVWWECKQCADYSPTEAEEDDGEFTRHGVLHQNIEGDWMTESNDCAATAADSASDAMQEEAENAGLGVHQIELDYEGDGYWSARRVIPQEERDRVNAKALELFTANGGNDWDHSCAHIRDYWRGRAYNDLKKGATT
ncbi:hypothetical protein [Arthrobacter sp. B3I4]|uniref:hypothetical protein n=1 Tax=Arthrobacter sp. B3I4 TaxID=3042267 RepID=UPI002786A7AC|nr:hypothetical protein [Arthrobacter sp. B3I4]MDQ0756099.1 hypothetical protein [Arthrobacter sp. B3I4]